MVKAMHTIEIICERSHVMVARIGLLLSRNRVDVSRLSMEELPPDELRFVLNAFTDPRSLDLLKRQVERLVEVKKVSLIVCN